VLGVMGYWCCVVESTGVGWYGVLVLCGMGYWCCVVESTGVVWYGVLVLCGRGTGVL
jgi:hypothetical protein